MWKPNPSTDGTGKNVGPLEGDLVGKVPFSRMELALLHASDETPISSLGHVQMIG